MLERIFKIIVNKLEVFVGDREDWKKIVELTKIHVEL